MLFVPTTILIKFDTEKHHLGTEAVRSYIKSLTINLRGDGPRLRNPHGLSFGVSLVKMSNLCDTNVSVCCSTQLRWSFVLLCLWLLHPFRQ